MTNFFSCLPIIKHFRHLIYMTLTFLLIRAKFLKAHNTRKLINSLTKQLKSRDSWNYVNVRPFITWYIYQIIISKAICSSTFLSCYKVEHIKVDFFFFFFWTPLLPTRVFFLIAINQFNPFLTGVFRILSYPTSFFLYQRRI